MTPNHKIIAIARELGVSAPKDEAGAELIHTLLGKARIQGTDSDLSLHQMPTRVWPLNWQGSALPPMQVPQGQNLATVRVLHESVHTSHRLPANDLFLDLAFIVADPDGSTVPKLLEHIDLAATALGTCRIAIRQVRVIGVPDNLDLITIADGTQDVVFYALGLVEGTQHQRYRSGVGRWRHHTAGTGPGAAPTRIARAEPNAGDRGALPAKGWP